MKVTTIRILCVQFFGVCYQLLFTLTWAHPQCLDFRPPFPVKTPISFCKEYQDYGCCGKKEDRTLRRQYRKLKRFVPFKQRQRCRKFFKQVLCQTCSPYAAHIFDAEGKAEARKFPGLCKDYCKKFYNRCKIFVKFIDKDLAASSAFLKMTRFCDKVSLKDTDYCYPNLKENPILKGFDDQQGKVNSSQCLCLETVEGQSLSNPLFARPAGDGSGRLFVAEQKGTVKIYYPRRKKWARSKFLNLKKRLDVTSYPGDERGLLGLAFHPRFKTNGRFFVYYTTGMKPSDSIPPELEGKARSFKSKVVISEMRVSSDNKNKADRYFEKIIVQLPQPYANHNGGEIFFLDDGYLYIFTGDGGASGDRMNAGQDKSLLYGKVLRLDIDTNKRKPYIIPKDNPFLNDPKSKPEIFAYGLRNTWRCGVDRGDPKTGADRGRVLCGDVGQNAYEEINLLIKGANYGWRAKEGFACYDDDMCKSIKGDTLPIHSYPHSVGKSVTGGVFYRGCEYPRLTGQYIYGDYVSEKLFSLKKDGKLWMNSEISLCGKDMCQGHLLSSVPGGIFSFGEDEDGEIYVMTSYSMSSSKADGQIHKIVDPSKRENPSSCKSDNSLNSRLNLSTKKRKKRKQQRN